MPINPVKPIRTFTVLHQRGEVLHVLPVRAELQPDGSLGPYAAVWQAMFAHGWKATEVQAVDRWSAVQAAAGEIGPYISERDWLIGQIDSRTGHSNSPDLSLPIRERSTVIDVLLESGFQPHIDPSGPAIEWEPATSAERRDWLARQPTAVLVRWYGHARDIKRPAVTPWG
ncbi:hypothetical protein [Streptomyces sp. NPDC047981]|uniref:hypothetical protein n=1 Tax=Streptomyces sp. NPDC047981 TaxID=3154610 RepID=UPI003443D8BD